MPEGDGSAQKPQTAADTTDAQGPAKPGQQPQQQAGQEPHKKDPWNKFTYNPRSSLGLEVNIRLEQEVQVAEDLDAQNPQ